jgi:glycosyltransferase involved in cell wall biosynthesis
MKPKIIHIIDSFSKGGAEILLAGIVPYLTEYDNYIIYLTTTPNPLTVPSSVHIECIEYRGLKDVFRTGKQLKKRFKEINPDIVHTHLIYATFFSRILLNKSIPLITTFHNAYYQIKYSTRIARIKNVIIQKLDQLTYSPSDTIIHVSKNQQLLNDADVGIKKSTVLYNYAENVFFDNHITDFASRDFSKLTIISVGNLKTEKNHILLLQAIQQIKNIPLQLDIYGEGPDRTMLQTYIDDNNLPVVLKGSTDSIEKILPQYNLFIQASVIEGFGISVAESMAIGIPVLLSDISTFKEITDNKAMFFQNNNIKDLVHQIQKIYNDPIISIQAAAKCKEVAERYRKEMYLKKIKAIYTEVLNGKSE